MITSEPNSPEAVVEREGRERRERVDSILQILKEKNIHFTHEADRDQFIINLTNSNMDLHEIEQLVLEIPQ